MRAALILNLISILCVGHMTIKTYPELVALFPYLLLPAAILVLLAVLFNIFATLEL